MMIDFVVSCHPKDLPSLKVCVNRIKENISVANSSYSWWSAFLSNLKYTIAPKKWKRNGTGCDIILDHWEKI